MDVYDTRQARLRELMRKQYDGKQSALAKAIERPDNYVSRMMSPGKNRKRIGEDLAREIETRLRLPRGYLDGPGSSAIAETATLYGMPISEEAVRLGREWEKLQQPLRAQVATMIESLVASQVRASRATTKQKAAKQSREGANHEH